MKCIYCEEDKDLVDSHVISNFIRKRLTGLFGDDTAKTFIFRFLGQEERFTQDLPKPKLLCRKCDNGFGTPIERPASIKILPKGDVSDPQAWLALPLLVYELPFKVGGQPLNVGRYQLENDEDDCALHKFAVLTAWRALHAMGRDGNQRIIDFLASEDGQQVHAATIQFLRHANPKDYLHFPYLATFHFLGPTSAAAVCGADDEMPFAWAYLQSGDQSCIAVMLGYWVIVWPLLPDGDTRRNFKKLLQLTYIDWHAVVIQQFSKARHAAELPVTSVGDTAQYGDVALFAVSRLSTQVPECQLIPQ